jgi:hypothetical protein
VIRCHLLAKGSTLAVRGKRCLGGTFRSGRGRVMFEADARASTHVDFRA